MTPEPLIFERGDKLYIVAPVSPFTPGATEIEEFAFAQDLKKLAPNENLMWLRGQYVEADAPNRNGQQWTSGELAIKSLTPMLMPVTVMHDPRTAVGTIADAKLLTPESDSVPRSRIDTSLCLWKHRFPDVCEEAQANYEQGSLMQSMECISPHYSCAECGQVFQKLADGGERKNWCAHLSEASGLAARILGNVVFTGTGLIFGTEGAEGAFDKAHLDVFQEEVAEFHDKAHRDKRQPHRRDRSPRRKRRMDPIEISREEYAELQKRPTRDDLEAATKRADDAEEAKTEAERKVEEMETAKKEAETARDEAVKERDALKDTAEQAKLRDSRMGKLGKDFKAKLGDFTADRLRTDAATLSDEDWTARLQEVSEMVGVKPDEGGEGDPENKGDGKGGENASQNGGSPEFSREEVARSQAGASGGSGGSGEGGKEPTDSERSSVMRGLIPAKK